MLHRMALCTGLAAVLLALAPEAPSAAGLGFIATVKSTHPIAYFRLTGTKGSSEVGTSTYTGAGGISVASGGSTFCAPISVAGNQCMILDGSTGYFDTSQVGGIRGAGSIMAWVHLTARPKLTGRILYVAGISQTGNDFDLQFEPDNTLRFYTAAAPNVAFSPPLATLEGEWHMIVATLSESTGMRAIYWDGQLAKSDHGGGTPGKTNEFSIGESKVFHGRFFNGIITDVALWNTALDADTVAKICASRLNP